MAAGLTESLGEILNYIAAAGAIGTAAYGLVDSSKAAWGGISNLGFGHVRKAVQSIIGKATTGKTVFGPTEITETLRANWLNGVAKADQKAKAKALIRLMLTPETAQEMATATGVNAAHLQAAAQRVRDDEDLTPQDLKVLGAFDVVVGATLDLGFERGDQIYRNAAKVAAFGCAVALAAIGSHLAFGAIRLADILVGVVATPLAPIAKDLSTSLSAAVKAVGTFKR